MYKLQTLAWVHLQSINNLNFEEQYNHALKHLTYTQSIYLVLSSAALTDPDISQNS